MNPIIELQNLTNEEFFARHALPGCVALAGGTALIDRVICRAQRHVVDDENWSCWSHAFLIQGPRLDGHTWVVESDLEIHRKHIRLGVQENRINKYFNEELYTTLAILDFGLTPEQIAAVLGEGLNLVADRTQYSIRELFGALIAMKHQGLRGKSNLLARDKSLFCSALVHHLFRSVSIDLVPGLEVKHTAPEDLFRSALPHTTYLLKREVATSRFKALRQLGRGKIDSDITPASP